MNFIEKRMKALEDERRYLEDRYGVEIRIKVSYWSAFTGGGGEIALLAFVFGAIAGGFFSEAGKDLWIKLKEFTKRITDRQQDMKDESRATIFAVF